MPPSGYTYSSNSQISTPYLQQTTVMQPDLQQQMPSIFDPPPNGALLIQECLRELHQQQAAKALK